MTTPRQISDRNGVLTVTTALLLVTAAGQMFVVVPSYRRLLESLGVVVSVPARAAIATSQLGLLLFALALSSIGVAYWKEHHGAAGLVPKVLGIVALLSAVYLALVACVYWDVARVMARLH